MYEYEQADQAAKSIQAIARMIETDPSCLDDYTLTNSIGGEDQSKVNRFLVQEFTIRLKHYVFVPPENHA